MSNMSPLDLEDYLAHGGYSGLVKAFEKMTPEEVCAEVRESGLRGRGEWAFRPASNGSRAAAQL